MPGETDLTQLLRTMKPELQPGTYVFCTVDSLEGFELAEVVGMFREREGLTVILPQATADRLRLPYTFVAAWITLTVHSALEAVGLTAAFLQALAQGGISCNVVAAYYHDHIFVAATDAEKAMHLLQELIATSSQMQEPG
ncbi:ACT domain-containing protein [Hymenobacter sediminis]|uniref:ACT domain-containing protein n=1 Tax=Hymenobacter sediminis TaxID=2218621 RepID=UPI000DA6521B|nr:ACT domain-containing protein [Hymenobacter sediminis]RPD46842.1 ACT domain-containing protein [Hymenobacter sediminis]